MLCSSSELLPCKFSDPRILRFELPDMLLEPGCSHTVAGSTHMVPADARISCTETLADLHVHVTSVNVTSIWSELGVPGMQ